MVGTSLSASDRVVVVTPSARSFPALMYSIDEVMATNLHLSADEIGQRGPGAAIGDMHEIDAGQHLEQFARHLVVRAGATGCHVDPTRIGLGIRRIDHH